MEDIEAGFMAERPKMKYDIVISKFRYTDFLDKLNYLEEKEIGVIIWEGFKVMQSSGTFDGFCVPVMLPRDFEWPDNLE